MTDIPFTHFEGQLKQLATEFPARMMRDLYDVCFSAFTELDERYAQMKRDGIEQLVNAAGVEINFGFRPRRFSGGPGLPSGRYFTLCDGEFNDRGTLRDEVTAYYSGRSGMTASILDPRIDVEVIDYLRNEHGLSDESAALPFYLIVYLVERRTEQNGSILEYDNVALGEPTGVTYAVEQFDADLPRIVDLRYPETQEWFTETFVRMELEHEERVRRDAQISFLFPKQEIESFEALLPVLVSLETGGGMIFGQAIGQWLRRSGAAGLIFPSARSNAFVRVDNGRPVEWGGWNLVVYAEAEQPVAESFFGRMGVWRDPDHDHIHVAYTDTGRERGSFSIRGVREFNLLQFDLKKQVAAGRTEEDPLAAVTGVKNQILSDLTNDLLAAERKQSSLWYADIDYTWFVRWLEGRWR
jgi:hypothetical protein